MMGITHAGTQLDAFREMKVDNFFVQFLKNLSFQVVQFGTELFEPCLQMHSHKTEQGCLLYPHAGFASGIGSSGSNVWMGAALTPRNAVSP